MWNIFAVDLISDFSSLVYMISDPTRLFLLICPISLLFLLLLVSQYLWRSIGVLPEHLIDSEVLIDPGAHQRALAICLTVLGSR